MPYNIPGGAFDVTVTMVYDCRTTLSLRRVLYIVTEQRHVLQYLTRVNGIAFLCSHGPPP